MKNSNFPLHLIFNILIFMKNKVPNSNEQMIIKLLLSLYKLVPLEFIEVYLKFANVKLIKWIKAVLLRYSGMSVASLSLLVGDSI